MALTMSCNLCADPTCDGKEYTVKYDYDHYGRHRGVKPVCSSQVFKQGGKFFHIIKAGKYEHKFEAIPVITLHEAVSSASLQELQKERDIEVEGWCKKDDEPVQEEIVAQEIDIDYSGALEDESVPPASPNPVTLEREFELPLKKPESKDIFDALSGEIAENVKVPDAIIHHVPTERPLVKVKLKLPLTGEPQLTDDSEENPQMKPEEGKDGEGEIDPTGSEDPRTPPQEDGELSEQPSRPS